MHKNYKQKWIEAQAGLSAKTDSKTKLLKDVSSDVSRLVTDSNLAQAQIRSALGEAVLVAKELADNFDSFGPLGELEFAKMEHNIDPKLHTMPSHVIIRRLRDVMKMVSIRCGMMAVRIDDLQAANDEALVALESLTQTRNAIDRSNKENHWIGPRPTPSEIDDFEDAAAGTYHRDGLAYESISDDWIERNVFNTDSIHEYSKSSVDTDDEINDDSDDELRSNDPPSRNTLLLARNAKHSKSGSTTKIDL